MAMSRMEALYGEDFVKIVCNNREWKSKFKHKGKCHNREPCPRRYCTFIHVDVNKPYVRGRCTREEYRTINHYRLERRCRWGEFCSKDECYWIHVDGDGETWEGVAREEADKEDKWLKERREEANRDRMAQMEVERLEQKKAIEEAYPAGKIQKTQLREYSELSVDYSRRFHKEKRRQAEEAERNENGLDRVIKEKRKWDQVTKNYEEELDRNLKKAKENARSEKEYYEYRAGKKKSSRLEMLKKIAVLEELEESLNSQMREKNIR